MNPDKYFSIIVKGDLSSEVEEGNLNKTTGQPDGPTVKIRLQNGGIAIPNFSKVWAKRITKGAKGVETATGELEFLKWGADGGEVVHIRYLDGYKSLDKHYQDNVLKVKLSEEEQRDSAYINLDIGVNDFNVEVIDPVLIDFLKHHTYCEDNASRNPSNKEVKYAIYNPEKMNSNKIEKMRAEKRAQDIILSAEQDSQRLMILAGLFELDPRSQDAVLFNELLDILEDTERVLKVVDFHSNRFKYVLTKLEDSGDLVYTDSEAILTIDHEREVLAKDIPTKNIKVYLVENMLDPDLFPVYQRVLEVDKKLIEALN